MTSLRSGVKLGLMNKIKIYLVTAYSILLVLIILFPPWAVDYVPYGSSTPAKSFTNFHFILQKGWGQNIHTTYLFFEIFLTAFTVSPDLIKDAAT